MIDRGPVSRPWLIVVSDRRRLCAAAGRPLADGPALLVAQAAAAAAAGATAFQLRERDLDARALHRLAHDVTAATAGRLQILINDRADIAAAAGVGVHLRADSMPAQRLRRWLPAEAWITQSVHDRAELTAAGPVDAVVAGAVFETASKADGHQTMGVAGLADLVAASSVPVVAIGGLTAASWPSLRRAGAAGIAAIGAFLPRAGESIASAVHRAVEEWAAVVDSPGGEPNIANSGPGGPLSMVLDTAEDLGAALRHHREAAHRSLREMADATKLGVRTLEALERNHVEKLPPGIFRRAVVRAYAREIGLDPEDTLRVFLARYPDDLPPPGPSVGPIADAEPPPARVSPVMLVCVVLAAVVVLLLAARAFGLPRPAVEGGVAPSIHRAPIPVAEPRGV